MKTELYFFRHAQTGYNAQGKHPGQINMFLNMTGIEQAINLRGRLHGMHFDSAYSSPSRRAHHTGIIGLNFGNPKILQANDENDIVYEFDFNATVGSSYAPKITTDSRIIERHVGIYQGLTRTENSITAINSGKPEGGESFEELEERVVSFLEDIPTHNKGKKVAIFTHGGVLQVVKKFYEDLSKEEAQQEMFDNCEMLMYSQ